PEFVAALVGIARTRGRNRLRQDDAAGGDGEDELAAEVVEDRARQQVAAAEARGRGVGTRRRGGGGTHAGAGVRRGSAPVTGRGFRIGAAGAGQQREAGEGEAHGRLPGETECQCPASSTRTQMVEGSLRSPPGPSTREGRNAPRAREGQCRGLRRRLSCDVTASAPSSACGALRPSRVEDRAGGPPARRTAGRSYSGARSTRITGYRSSRSSQDGCSRWKNSSRAAGLSANARSSRRRRSNCVFSAGSAASIPRATASAT